MRRFKVETHVGNRMTVYYVVDRVGQFPPFSRLFEKFAHEDAAELNLRHPMPETRAELLASERSWSKGEWS